MDSQTVVMIIVWVAGIGLAVILLVLLSGFLQWLLGISEIIGLLRQQNKLLEQWVAQQPPPTPSPPDVAAPKAPVVNSAHRRNPLTGR